MKITRKQLTSAVEHGILSATQADSLIEFIQRQTADVPRFTFTHVLYYLGGLMAIGAMTLFMNLGWESFGGAGIFFLSLLYAGVGLKLTNHFASRQLSIPAGITATFVVCMTPLAIYGLQHWLGLWPDESQYRDYHRYVKWHWLYMELGTLAVGVIVAWRYKYPFLIMPIAFTLWYMSMDIVAIIGGGAITWELRQQVSMYTGLLMIALAVWVDIRAHHTADYAFWIYLFGVLAFWGGLSMQHSDSELAKFMYFCTNLFMICVGVLLVRRIFVVCGALGAYGYLGHLAFSVFKDSWMFPVALTAMGLSLIYLGILWQKYEQRLIQKFHNILPAPLKSLLASKRG
ncbi:MAG: DUF2157 domain-containing protein [Pseudomonadaceae bacterium]|nr:DUF2157 domain-containing protein [Pseudomonadaceae bacterium]